MRGHIATKGEGKAKRYYVVVDIGRHAAQRCTACRKRTWIENGRELDACTKCGGELRSVVERRQLWSKGFRTKREAEQHATTIVGQIDHGTHVAPTKQTLAEYLLDEWLPAIEANVRPTTLVNYRTHVVHHIVPAIGDVRLSKVTPSMLQSFYAHLIEKDRSDGTRKLSRTTVRRVHATLHRALQCAFEWNRLTRNPADAAKPPKAPARPEMQTWDSDELGRFLDSVRDDRLAALWHLIATTGLRRGEAIGLRWGDIDLTKRTLAVRRAVVAAGYAVHETDPKSQSARRVVKLSPETTAILKAHRARQAQEQLAVGSGFNDTGLVFCRERGGILHPDRVSKMFDAAVRRAGVTRIRLHDVRHTHATILLADGVHPKIVSERLGHSSIGMTIDIYSHVTESMQEQVASRIDELISGAAR